MVTYRTVDEYIESFSEETRSRLEEIRKTIRASLPSETTEKISYGIPTYYLNGNLVHFGGYKSHIGLYPGSAPIADFREELKEFKTSKGTVQFPHNKPLPLNLIKKIVDQCLKRNLSKKSK